MFFSDLKRKGLTLMSALGAAVMVSCGGGGGDGDSDADPTLTSYAPQTLDRVRMVVYSDDGGVMEFEFSSVSRPDPEFETGTFVYTNASTTDVNADTITGGTYSYLVTGHDSGILEFTGGEGTATSPMAYRFVGTLNGTMLPLDFGNNVGRSSSTVRVTVDRIANMVLSGNVTVDGLPLPLNYNGRNAGVEDPIRSPFVPHSLNGRTLTFTNASDMPVAVEFISTGGGNGLELGIASGSTGSYEFTSYEYRPDLTGAHEAELVLRGSSFYGEVVFALTFSASGQTARANDYPFPISPRPFLID